MKVKNNSEKKYDEIIEKLYELFKDNIDKDDSKRIIRTLKNIPCLTIFEAFNLIFREVQITKTISNSELNKEEKNMIIFENKDMFEENDKYNEVMNKYKIKSDDINIEEEFWKPIDESDERRIVKINKRNNTFNYLPLYKNSIYSDNKNIEELFSKNENEYLYHPLFYKTIMCHFCKIEKDKKNYLCPYSHDIQTDFRIIYDYKNEDICKFLNFLYNSKLISFTNYLNYINIDPLNFDSNEFKILKCLSEKCILDQHLCLFYHSSNEKRRSLQLFRYTVNDKENKKCNAKECPNGIFCNGIHTNNEYNYHPKKFRKEIDCQRSKKNDHCIFIKTCYGIHPEEEYKIYENEDIKEKLKSEDEDIKNLNEKLETVNLVGKILKCRKCQKIPKNGKIKYLGECKHFLCFECFNEVYEDDKICPFCDKNISKKNVTNFYFKKI